MPPRQPRSEGERDDVKAEGKRDDVKAEGEG